MRRKRYYSLFWKKDGRWKRLSTVACRLARAREVYQNALLAGSLAGQHMELRPGENNLRSLAGEMEVYKNLREWKEACEKHNECAVRVFA